jgi:hypothetical protein
MSAQSPRAGEVRPSFHDAVAQFVQFLTQNGWSDDLRWISAADITGHRNRFWVFRPAELANERLTEDFYNAAIASPSSVRFDAMFQFEGLTLAWVEDFGGDSQCLNYGVSTSSATVTAITSSFVWHVRRATNRFQRESPIVRFTKIPNAQKPD